MYRNSKNADWKSINTQASYLRPILTVQNSQLVSNIHNIILDTTLDALKPEMNVILISLKENNICASFRTEPGMSSVLNK